MIRCACNKLWHAFCRVYFAPLLFHTEAFRCASTLLSPAARVVSRERRGMSQKKIPSAFALGILRWLGGDVSAYGLTDIQAQFYPHLEVFFRDGENDQFTNLVLGIGFTDGV